MSMMLMLLLLLREEFDNLLLGTGCDEIWKSKLVNWEKVTD